MSDRHQEWLAECDNKVPEVSTAKLPLAKGSKPEDAHIVCEYAFSEHMRENILTVSGRHRLRNRTKPKRHICSRDALLLQNQRHDLLREDVRRPRWGNDRLNGSLSPQGRQG